mmetsp:Transcript_101464/g.194661  ORF Transcript_101464/g.194661 Transcript_101464/m.194661 type:complete len:216 (+) Transcript_101464:312-959(+)
MIVRRLKNKLCSRPTGGVVVRGKPQSDHLLTRRLFMLIQRTTRMKTMTMTMTMIGKKITMRMLIGTRITITQLLGTVKKMMASHNFRFWLQSLTRRPDHHQGLHPCHRPRHHRGRRLGPRPARRPDRRDREHPAAAAAAEVLRRRGPVRRRCEKAMTHGAALPIPMGISNPARGRDQRPRTRMSQRTARAVAQVRLQRRYPEVQAVQLRSPRRRR